jgi:glutathione S-transferase
MDKPHVFGADYSVYVRISRLSLHEKGVDYDLTPVDIFALDSASAAYLERQPFGKIPSFEHNGFRLYETGAITRYVDEAFQGPALQPSEPKKRARVNQIISIADGYIYPQLVWGLYVELVSKVKRGEPIDASRVAIARAKAPLCLKVLSDFLGDSPWLGGDCLTLADLYVAPMLYYFLMVPDGQEMFSEKPNLAEWLRHMGSRESMQITRPTT